MLTRDALQDLVGTSFGHSEWLEISQQKIDAFADLTQDWQPIHLEPEAGRQAGFQGSVAHGFLTLSMLSAMSYQVLPKIQGETSSINYGFDRIRFMAPVPAGARIRGTFVLSEAEPRGDAWMLRFAVTVDIQGYEKPALFVDWLCLYNF
ncbi:MAG: MaoC family dehydratase [Roseobacter sp.]